ncbi:zinc finger protein 878-like [Contarinia nasturtii]|uniref:zinc finger protein 878-like n=1 Tax=Contarinia nasturtii TaxID=265458 RepID=UPI0012D3D5F2|nr:zinc finger protein 878-like [Contarinia nasturtii]
MNQIEGILFESDSLSNHNQPVLLNRIKMGEVFQLPNERYALVCIHCSEEFQYFSEFTLHVQDHFLQMNAQIDEMETINTESIKTEMEIIDSISRSSIKSETSIQESNVLNQKQDIEANVKTDIDYSDDDFSNLLDVCIDNSCDEQEEIPTVPAKQATTKELVIKSTTKSKAKRKTKAKTTKPCKKPKRMKLESIEVANAYENLLAEYRDSIEDAMDPVKFEIFKAEKVDGLFPCTIKDTAEVRLLAALSLNSFKYEKVDKEHLCPVCKAPFPNPASVRRHVFSHVKEKVFLCGFCEQKFRTIRYLRGHLREKHQNEKQKFECFLCHKQFSHNQFRAMKDHIQSHQFANLHCTLCNKKFKEYRFYQLHMINIHPHGIDLNNQNRPHQEPIDYRQKPVITSFECYLCRKNFRERRLLRSHMKLHIQQPRLCLVCGIFCSSATSLSRHMKLHDSDETKSHFCNLCNKGFKVRQYLLRHNRKEHGIWADNTPPKCSICGQEFDKKSLLHEHMKTHPFEETRNFMCNICNHAAKNAYNLKRHMQTHSNDRSFECHICAKTFHPRYAKDHMKSHTEAPKHKCPICTKKFKRKYALKQHMYQHGGAPEHKCDICGKAFARTDKLLRHRRRHGIPLNYHCKICLKGFISQKSYLLHESSHMKEKTSTDVNQFKSELLDDH